MQFHILNENYTPIAVMDNTLPDAIHFQKSKLQRFLTGSADFFDFETSKIHVDSSKFQVGYWIAFKYDSRDRLMYINDIQEAERDKTMSISTLSNNLDLNQEKTQPFSADIARPFDWYFNHIMNDTGYEIGINEISNLTRKLSWDSEMSHRTFLQSVATQFDNAELDYEVILNSDFTIKKRLVHVKKQVGEVRDDIELRYGKNIKTVKRSTNIDNLYTAIKPISKDDNGKVTDISSMPDWQKLDKNGNVVLFHKKGSTLIQAPQANDRFGNRGSGVTSGGYVVFDYSFDKVSQTELFNRSVTKLEEISVPAVNYEVEGHTDAKIGDTVKIVDDEYSPELILSARVLEQVVSFDDVTVEQATFGNYKALQSQISTDLIAKMQQLADENAPYKAVTLTTNGLTFKNSEGSTLLTARLYKGTKEIVPESYDWTIDSVSISGSGEQREITADDIDGKAVIRWSAIINGEIVAFDEVTIIDVSDGVDGDKTHVAYAYSSDGMSGFVTAYPNLNLLDGTRDFSGYWGNTGGWFDDGLYGDLNVKSFYGQWNGIYKAYTVTTDGDYTFSTFVKSDDSTSEIHRYVLINEQYVSDVIIGNQFDWKRDSYTFSGLSAGDTVYVKYENASYNSQKLSVSGHKLENGSSATAWMPSSSEVTTSDYPKYRGEYSDISSEQSTNPSNYTWTLARGDDGVKGDTGQTGEKGDPTGVTKSAIEPENKFYGMIWYVDSDTDVSSSNMEVGSVAQSHGQYTWNGTKWSLYMLRSINLIVDDAFINNAMIGSVDATKITTGTLDAERIASSSITSDKLDVNEIDSLKITNTYTYDDNGVQHNGVVTIDNGVKIVDNIGTSRTIIDLVYSSSGHGLFVQSIPDISDMTKFKQAWYSSDYMYMSDTINNFGGSITASNLTSVPWIDLTLLSGFKAGDGVQPQYRRIKNLDGSYSVQFRGAISPTSGNFPTTQVQVATLSGIYLPPSTAMRQGSDNTGKGGRVAVVNTGQFYILAPNTSSYVYIDALTYIN